MNDSKLHEGSNVVESLNFGVSDSNIEIDMEKAVIKSPKITLYDSRSGKEIGEIQHTPNGVFVKRKTLLDKIKEFFKK